IRHRQSDTKTKLLLWCATGLVVALTRAQATTHYVDADSTNAVPSFTNWTTAAAVIQDAVDVSVDGDERLLERHRLSGVVNTFPPLGSVAPESCASCNNRN